MDASKTEMERECLSDTRMQEENIGPNGDRFRVMVYALPHNHTFKFSRCLPFHFLFIQVWLLTLFLPFYSYFMLSCLTSPILFLLCDLFCFGVTGSQCCASQTCSWHRLMCRNCCLLRIRIKHTLLFTIGLQDIWTFCDSKNISKYCDSDTSHDTLIFSSFLTSS